MKTTILVATLAVVLATAWAVYAKDIVASGAAHAPAVAAARPSNTVEKGPVEEMSIEISPNGAVSLSERREENGKTVINGYRADSWKEFEKKYPEIAHRYAADLHPPEKPLEEMKAWEKETEHLLTLPDFMKEERHLLDVFGHPQFGIWIDPVDGALASQLGLAEGEGVLVRDVEEGSPAAKAGLREYDVIVKLDGEAVKGLADLSHRIRESMPKGMTLEVIRGGKPLTVHAAPHAAE